jgi:hypothetical protein
MGLEVACFPSPSKDDSKSLGQIFLHLLPLLFSLKEFSFVQEKQSEQKKETKKATHLNFQTKWSKVKMRAELLLPQ